MLSAPVSLFGQTESHTISQDAPILLHEYETELVTRSGQEVVEHHVSYVHQADTTVLGIEFGIIEFNLFRDLLDYSLFVETKTTKNGKFELTFESSPQGAFAFYEGVAYVSRVRLADDRVWEASTDEVLGQVRDSIGATPEVEIDSLRQRERSQSI
ncbi:hypothetical protein [Salinibacter sp.]|uniref:hypothetical protein n=1 Tax=Salinibacter sp. TaxID=2065818 RepID=UPI0021E81DFA|nr:hypothetical protein [Salinibacter sp.]